MSRVVQTELFDGDTASAADFNATLTSWNAATAAGQIGANNFREEGLDRGVFAVNSVKSSGSVAGFRRFTDNNIFVAPPGFTTLAPGSVIGPFQEDELYNVLVHYSVMVRTDSGLVGVRLARSANAGGPWAAVANTYRVVSTRSVATPYSVARVDRSITVSKLVTGVAANTPVYFALQIQSTSGVNTLVQGTLFGEVFYR